MHLLFADAIQKALKGIFVKCCLVYAGIKVCRLGMGIFTMIICRYALLHTLQNILGGVVQFLCIYSIGKTVEIIGVAKVVSRFRLFRASSTGMVCLLLWLRLRDALCLFFFNKFF